MKQQIRTPHLGKLRRWQCIGLLLLCVAVAPFAAHAQGAPRVSKFDPPNWWSGLPNPMLLLRGENLNGATVKTSDDAVRVTRTQASQNGHWLFVWLQTQDAPPRTVQLAITAAGGRTVVSFRLDRRRPNAASFAGFSADDVMYLIMPDRFADGDPANNKPPQSPGTYDRSKPRAYHGGDLKGITQHLDYLKQLGITALWLTPIVDNDNRSPEDYHGYGGVDLYAVDEHFGTLADYQHLVAEAHRRGMKVLFDAVPNHVGPRHIWASDPPTTTWLHGTKAQHLRAQPDFPALTDPHATPREWRSTVEGWFGDLLPDLNQSDPLVAQYLVQNTMWWIESAQLDGLRLDTFPYVNLPFWRDFHAALHTAYPRLKTVGEVWHPDPTVVAYFGGEVAHDGIDTGLDTLFDFPFFFALRNVILKDAPATDLVDVFRRDWLYPHPEKLVTFIGNHDTIRFMGEPGASKQKLKLAFSILLTTRGVPQVYSGDELGMPGGGDPDNRRDFPGGFPGDAHSAFTAQGRTADEQEVFSHVQRLLQLRQEHGALRRGRQWHIAFGKDFYAYLREDGNEQMLMVFNNAGHQAHFHLDFTDTPLASAHQIEPLLDALPGRVSSGAADVDVPARSVAIYQVRGIPAQSMLQFQCCSSAPRLRRGLLYSR